MVNLRPYTSWCPRSLCVTWTLFQFDEFTHTRLTIYLWINSGTQCTCTQPWVDPHCRYIVGTQWTSTYSDTHPQEVHCRYNYVINNFLFLTFTWLGTNNFLFIIFTWLYDLYKRMYNNFEWQGVLQLCHSVTMGY